MRHWLGAMEQNGTGSGYQEDALAHTMAQYVARNGPMFEGLLRRRKRMVQSDSAFAEYLRSLMHAKMLPDAGESRSMDALLRWEHSLDQSDAQECAAEFSRACESCESVANTAAAMLARLADRAVMLRASSAQAAADSQKLLLVLHALLIKCQSSSLPQTASDAVLHSVYEIVAALAYARGGVDDELSHMMLMWKQSAILSDDAYSSVAAAAHSCALPPRRRVQSQQDEAQRSDAKHVQTGTSSVAAAATSTTYDNDPQSVKGDGDGAEVMDVEQVSTLPAAEPVNQLTVGQMPDCVHGANGGTPGAYQPLDPSTQSHQAVRRGDSSYIASRMQRLYDDLTGGFKRRQLEADRMRERERAGAAAAAPL